MIRFNLFFSVLVLARAGDSEDDVALLQKSRQEVNVSFTTAERTTKFDYLDLCYETAGFVEENCACLGGVCGGDLQALFCSDLAGGAAGYHISCSNCNNCCYDAYDDEPNIEEERRFLAAEGLSYNTTNIPATYDVRNDAICGQVASFARDQGNCGSCWAHAAAYVLSVRLCKGSRGLFSGPSAQLSAGYIASCSKEKPFHNNGCRGGTISATIKWVGTRGAVTENCIPYFDTRVGPAPQCDAQLNNGACKAGQHYARTTIAQDEYWDEGWERVTTTNIAELAKAQIYYYGSTGLIHKVYLDFPRYVSGIYNPRIRVHIGDHAMALCGYGSNYMTAMNSWGNMWGEQGSVRMEYAPDWMYRYTLIGDMRHKGRATSPGQPYPLPRGPPIVDNNDDTTYPGTGRRRRVRETDEPTPRPTPKPTPLPTPFTPLNSAVRLIFR